MFNTENTDGFSAEQIKLLNAAVTRLMESGVEEKSAQDIVNNNWTDGENTVESLARRD